MDMPNLEDMADYEFLKWLMVDLADKHGFESGGYVLTRMLMLVEHLEAAGLVPEEAPSAAGPEVLRDRLIDIVFKTYIGVSASRVKAENAADKILFTLTAFYEKQEREEIARMAEEHRND